MHISLARLCAFLAVVSLAASCRTQPMTRAFPDASTLPSQAAPPDPLILFDGRRVASPPQWLRERRPELKALFAHYMYGSIPPRPGPVTAHVVAEHRGFLEGRATLRLLTLDTGSAKAPHIDLMLVLPNESRGPAPVFLAMNFCGNHALTSDPRVPLSRGWLYDSCKGCVNHSATEAARGAQAADWPLEEIIGRGYALAAFSSADVDSDRAHVSDGLFASIATDRGPGNNPTNRGTIAAWAWGFHRCVDYLTTAREIDATRIAAVGHSRNGKTALLAAAFDERITLAIPHQAGCGGTAPSRGTVGESVKRINTAFPHWFNGEFKKFNEDPTRLPFDQHCLVALCAPRPVLFSNAQEDQWANPSGQFEMLRAADPVYRFLGVEGISATEPPPHRKLVDSRLGYYIREGKHSMTADDWKIFMDFADHQWGGRGR